MSTVAQDDTRRIIPRWPTQSTGLAAPELSGGRPTKQLPHYDEAVHGALVSWSRQRDRGTAVDLCGAAIVAGTPDIAKDAACYLRKECADKDELRRLADAILGDSQEAEPLGIEARIRRLRKSLRLHPDDAARWADLARCYATLGRSDAAMHSMLVASQLGRSSRAIARAAVRCFVHLGEPDRARSYLASTPIAGDPWIMAAAIAVDHLFGKPSTIYQRAVKLIGIGQLRPNAVSELRVAVGSQELWYGNERKGKQHLRESLSEATENSVAQIAWFIRRGMVNPAILEGSNALPSDEAIAWRSFEARQWKQSVSACGNWLRCEPYSSRPSELASFIAAVGMEDHELCISYAENGLRANPDDAILWNNLAVGYAEIGKLKEAVRSLKTAETHLRVAHEGEGRKVVAITLEATKGLIAFRSGELDEGRRHYEKALELATREKRDAIGRLAELHLIREELRAGRHHDGMRVRVSEARRSGDVMVETMAERLAKVV